MKIQKEQKFFIYAISSIIGFLIITHFFTPIIYAVNDDVIMRTIASGELTGTPDGHLIYVQYVVGVVIAFLYRIYKHIDWYGCFMLSVVLGCTVIMLWRAKKIFKNNCLFGLVCVLAVFSVAIFENIVCFQFTVVSAIAGATAIFYYWTIDTNKENYKKDYLLVLVLAWLSYGLRGNVFIMALPFAGLAFLFKKTKWREKIILCVVLFVGLGSITAVEKVAYATPEWDNYYDFNEYGTVPLYDYYGFPAYEENRKFYESIGIEECDLKNLEEYNLYFVDGIDKGKIQQIGKYAEELWKQTSLSSRVMTGIKATLKGYFGTRAIVLNGLAKCLLLAVVWLGIKTKNKKTVAEAICVFGVEMILGLYLGYDGRMVVRVITSLFLMEFFSLLAVLYSINPELPEGILKNRLAKVVFAGFVLVTGFMTFEVSQNQQIRYEHNQEWDELQEFFKENEENIYFLNTYYVANYTENFKVFRQSHLKNWSRLGEWTTYSAVDNAELHRYGTEEVDRALIEKDNVYLIYEGPAQWVDEHYAKDYGILKWIEVDKVPVQGKQMPVYQLRIDEK